MDQRTERDLLYMHARQDDAYLRWLIEKHLELEERHNTLAGELALSMRECRNIMRALTKKHMEELHDQET